MDFNLPIIVISITLLLAVILLYARAQHRLIRSEACLKAEQEQLGIMLRSIGDGIIATDKRGLITLINPAAQKLTGWNEVDAMGKPLAEVFQIINAQSRMPVINPVAAVLSTGKTQGLANHTVLISRTGREYHIADAGAPILDRQGEVSGAILSFSDVTERYHAEQKQLLAQQQIANLISTLPGVVYRCRLSRKWPMEFISDGIQKITGHSSQDFFPRGDICFGDLVHPDDQDQVFERISDAVEYSAPFTINYRLLDTSGGEHWVLENGFVAFDEASGEPMIEGFIIDISQISWDSNALRQTEFHFQRIADALPLAFFETNAAGQFTYINQTGLDLLGFTPQKIKEGARLLDSIAAADLEHTTTAVQTCRREGTMQTLQILITRPNGTVVPTLFQARPIAEDNPEGGLVGYFIDITERLNAERAKHEERENLCQLFHNMTTGVAIFEYDNDKSDFVVIDLNEPGEKISGIHRDEAIGKHLIEAFPESADRGIYNALLRANETGQTQLIGMHEGDTTKLSFVELRALRLPSGRLVLLFEDRSEQQKLANRILQMEKMDAIGQLAGGIAHDFNNQVGVILGYADMLQEVAADPVQRRYVSNIINCAHNAADLTKKLLAFARKGKFRFMEIDLHTIVSDVAEILSHSIDKKITIELALEAEIPTTFGDPAQLQNALMNLAINARDAMEQGGVLRFISHNVVFDKPTNFDLLGFDLDPGPYIQITISDTGCGIPNELFAHIFEPFFTTKETGKGNGMGLAAVYGTIKNHKGAIDLSSEVDKGTSFTLFLPQMGAAHAVPDAAPDTSVLRINARILVIEDEKSLRAMLNDLLYSIGCSAVFFSRGAEGVAHFAEHTEDFDLVMLDMVMPGMNGQETFKALCKIKPDVRVLLISGYSIDGAAQKLIDQGAAGFVQKPFERATLVKTIHQILSQETTA